MTLVVFQRVLAALAIDAITGPLWWYTGGLVFIGKWWRSRIAHAWQSIGVSVWFTNLFVPMFGQYDWQGRIISFFVRLFQVIVRSVAVVFVVLVYSGTVVLWVVIPPVVLWFFVNTLF